MRRYCYLKGSFFLIIFSIFVLIPGKNFPQKNLTYLSDDISIDSIMTTIKQLSGYVSVNIGGEWQKIDSRIWYTQGKELARQYIQQRLTRMGITNNIQSFDSDSGKNIIAEIPGYLHPDQHYIICAHYDDMSPDTNHAPGADDNASGVAVVLEAARVLKEYSLPYSMIFAFWDQEERGYYGSSYYANNAWSTGKQILGVLNMDQMSYDANHDYKAQVRVDSTLSSSVVLGNKVIELNNNYDIGVDFIVTNRRKSDHAAFWDYHYAAVGLLEETDYERNPHYHRTSDSVVYINSTYVLRIAKAAIATLAYYNEIPFPVELSSFTGKVLKNSVQLFWETKTEINNYAFEIERRTLSTNWIRIGEVKGSGNTNSPRHYSFKDKDFLVNGRYYYRLKQIDNGGQFKYSNEIEAVVSSIPDGYSLENNYPNPFNSSTVIRFSLPYDSNVRLTIYNVLGDVVKEVFSGVQSAGEYEKSFDASTLSSGIYFYALSAAALNSGAHYYSVKKMTLLK